MSRRRSPLLPDAYDTATARSRQHAFVISRFSPIEYEVWRTLALMGPRPTVMLAQEIGHTTLAELEDLLEHLRQRQVVRLVDDVWAIRDDVPWQETQGPAPAKPVALEPVPEHPWWEGPLMALDTETTSADPRTARIVSIALLGLMSGPEGETVSETSYTALVNPGVPIPADATRIHGITTAQVQALGKPLEEALRAVLTRLERWAHPLVIFNAPYDWTLLHCEAARVGLTVGQDLGHATDQHILDPLVIERYLRAKASGHTLGAVAKRYGLEPEGALHGARADALLAGRIVREQARTLLPQMTLHELDHAQPAWHRVWRLKQNAWRRSAGKPLITGDWPLG